MKKITADIIGHWKTKSIWINGKHISPKEFIHDLKADEQEQGENKDIIQECKGVRQFTWGDANQATYCLALACCFYLNVKWVMDRFFTKELEKVPQGDIRLFYNDEQIQAAHMQCEEMFSEEFSNFMSKIGARKVDEN